MTRPPEHTASLLTRLVGSLRSRSGEISEIVSLRIRRELPDYYAIPDPCFQSAGYGALAAVLATAWRMLENDGREPEHLPSALVDEAQNSARTGVQWEVIDRSYGMTHEGIWDAALEEVAGWQLPRSDAQLLLRVASKFLFRCFDWLTTQASKVYVAERDEWLDRRQMRVREMVSEVIDGLAVPDVELGYRTQQHHLGVIGWGRAPERAIADAARRLGAELLSVPTSGSTVWAWLGRASFARLESCDEAFAPDLGTHLALGAIGRGRSGFAQTHQQALLASWVAVRRLEASGRSVTRYPEVAVEAIGLADASRARIFVQYVLGPLAASDARSRRLRETLRAYCDAGHNSSAAASRLGISERTVRYRIRTVEELLGEQFDSGLLEPWLAARLLDSLEGQSHLRRLDALETASTAGEFHEPGAQSTG